MSELFSFNCAKFTVLTQIKKSTCRKSKRTCFITSGSRRSSRAFCEPQATSLGGEDCGDYSERTQIVEEARDMSSILNEVKEGTSELSEGNIRGRKLLTHPIKK